MNCSSRVEPRQMDLNAQLNSIFWKPGRSTEAFERCRSTQVRVSNPIQGMISPSKGEQDITPKQIEDLKAGLDAIFKDREPSGNESDRRRPGHGKDRRCEDGDSASIQDLKAKLEDIFKVKGRSRISCENRCSRNRYTDGDSFSGKEHDRMARDREDTRAQLNPMFVKVGISPIGTQLDQSQSRVRHSNERPQNELDSAQKRWVELNAKLNVIFGKSPRGSEPAPEVTPVVKPFIDPIPEDEPTRVVPPKKQADLLRRYQLKRLPELPKPLIKRTNEDLEMERLCRRGPIVAGPNTADIFGKKVFKIEVKGSKQSLKPEDAAPPVRKGPDQVSLMLKAKREAREKKLQSALNPKAPGRMTSGPMTPAVQVPAPVLSKSEQIQKQIHDLVLQDSDPEVRCYSKDQRFLDLMAALEPVFKPSLQVKQKVKAYQELFSPPSSPSGKSSATASARSNHKGSGYPNAIIKQVERDISQIAKMDRIRYPSMF